MAKKRRSEAERLRLGERCQVLDMNGTQCRARACDVELYHGDGEIYSAFDEPRISWVRVPMCLKHFPKRRESSVGRKEQK
jgi:hypothetical protein